MTRNALNHQPDLFDDDQPPVQLTKAQRDRLATLVQALLTEIAVALAAGEAGDD